MVLGIFDLLELTRAASFVSLVVTRFALSTIAGGANEGVLLA